MKSPEAKLEVSARSETGFVRNENQDRMSGSKVPLGHLYIVADGMGGHKGGAIAAELTIQGLQQIVGAAPSDASVEQVIHRAFKEVNETIYHKAHSGNSDTENMGSTAVLLLVSGGSARLAHVGDSRAYLYRQGRLKLMTKDHTIVQKMIDTGMLKSDEAANHPNASVLERAVGSKIRVEVDISDQLTLVDGDAFLLCSDGLSGYVADPEIEKVLHGPATVQQVPERLMELALAAGGEDNITVQFIQYGRRTEAQVGSKTTKELPVMKVDSPRPSYLKIAIFFLSFAAICVGIYFYFENKLSSANNVSEQLHLFQDRNKKLQGQLDGFKGELEALTEKLAGVNDDKVEQQRRVEELNATLGRVQAELKKTNNQVGTLQSKVSQVETKLKKAENQAKNLPTQLEAEKKKISKPEADPPKKSEPEEPVPIDDKVQ